MVLRKAGAVGTGNIDGKLSAKWEGPYLVKKVLALGTFRLASTCGVELGANWNIDTLKKYYV